MSSALQRKTLGMLAVSGVGLCCLNTAWANATAAGELPAGPPTAEASAPPLVEPMSAPGARIDLFASLRALSGYLTPADMGELSRFMFEVVMDFFKGTQEASLPPDLVFKLAVLEQRFKKEGDAYMQQVLRDLERDLRRFVSENLPFLPPLPPFPDLRAKNGP